MGKLSVTPLNFRWRDVPIPDIHAWARTRGEQMVRYHATRKRPNPFAARMETEEMVGEMPESFWNSLLMSEGWHYRETGRYDP